MQICDATVMQLRIVLFLKQQLVHLSVQRIISTAQKQTVLKIRRYATQNEIVLVAKMSQPTAVSVLDLYCLCCMLDN